MTIRQLITRLEEAATKYGDDTQILISVQQIRRAPDPDGGPWCAWRETAAATFGRLAGWARRSRCN